MIEKIEVFNYQETPVSFKNANGVVYVNATEMAKPFGKTTKDYLRNQSVQDFINAIAIRQNCLMADLVRVTKGGNDRNETGTWIHEDIALDFAKWLSIDFRIWCNDRIKELLKHGFTATENKIEEMIANPDLIISLATQLKKEREEKRKLAEQNSEKEVQLQIQAPKVKYVDDVLSSSSTILTTVIAKELAMSAIKLNKILMELKIIYPLAMDYVLYSPYDRMGYAITKTHQFVSGNSNKTYTRHALVWTEAGRMFVHDRVKKYLNGIKK